MTMSDHGHPVDPERVAAARGEALSAADAAAVAALLTVLAHPLRTRILCSLRVTGEMCVGDLALALDATEDAVSYALRLLRTAGLVRRRRAGRLGYYRLRDGDAGDAMDAALQQLRALAVMHPEFSADDDDPA
jgi:DNA-binding transcriptional ArsR family regulator